MRANTSGHLQTLMRRRRFGLGRRGVEGGGGTGGRGIV